MISFNTKPVFNVGTTIDTGAAKVGAAKVGAIIDTGATKGHQEPEDYKIYSPLSFEI